MRRVVRILWLVCCGAWVGAVILPEGNTLFRLVFIAMSLVLWLGALGLGWRRKWIRRACLGSGIVAALLLLAPGRKGSPESLRGAYVAALGRYENTRYIWGGESFFGIDCSGLVRKGMSDACVWLGVRSLNPSLVREGIDIWWYDCTARDLKDGYRRMTRRLFGADSIDSLDHSRIRPGDLAVTRDGMHVLAYLGDRTWIEAHPGEKVIRVHVPAPSNSWFQRPVEIVRWRQLE
jgi:hypothetical protein